MPIFADAGTAQRYHKKYVEVYPEAVKKSYNAVMHAIKDRDDITLDNEFIQRLEKIKPVLSLAGLLKNIEELLPAIKKVREGAGITKELFGKVYKKLIEIINPENAEIEWKPEGTTLYFNNIPVLENNEAWNGSFYEIFNNLFLKYRNKVKINDITIVTPDLSIDSTFSSSDKDYEIFPHRKSCAKKAKKLLKKTINIKKRKDEFTKRKETRIKEPSAEQFYQTVQLLNKEYNEKLQVTKLNIIIPAEGVIEYLENPDLSNIKIKNDDFRAEIYKHKNFARLKINITNSARLTELQKELRNSINSDKLYNQNEPDTLLSICHAYSSALYDVIDYLLKSKLLKGKTPSLEEVLKEVQAKPGYGVRPQIVFGGVPIP